MPSTILKDLAVVVVTAGTTAVAAPRLRVPALPAYLLAGIALGWASAHSTNTWLADRAALESLSNLGVTFLMFAIGLEFDFRKAKPLIGPGMLAVVIQYALMFSLGTATAALLGWTKTEGAFFGGLLGVSSTMVAVATLREKGWFEKTHGRLTIAVLVLEDVVTIVLLVLLAGLGVHAEGGGEAAPKTVWQTVLSLGAFVTVLLTVGRLGSRRWLPSMNLDKYPDLLAPMVGGLVLGVGLLAEQFSFSPALGAFVIGAAVSETKGAKRIMEIAEPLRDLFSAVFFVTLGVGIRPELLVRMLPAIVPVTILLVAGKTFACWAGSFLGGQKSDTGVRMALNKAQIGEFSFVIAAVGEHAGITRPELTATTAGVALLSILVNRPLVNRGDRIVAFTLRHSPASFRRAGESYAALLAEISARIDRATLWNLVRRPLAKTGLHLLFFLTVTVATQMVCLRLGDELDALARAAHMPEAASRIALWLLAGIGALPFGVAIMHQVEATLLLLSEITATPGRIRNPLAPVRVATFAVELALGAVFLAFAYPWMPNLAAAALILPLAGMTRIFETSLKRIQSRFEVVFLESFSGNGSHSDAHADRLRRAVNRHKWPLHLREVKIEPHTRAAGVSLAGLSLRAKAGTFVMAVQRDGTTFFDPGPDTPLFPGDELMLLGTAEQLDAAALLLGEPVATDADTASGFMMDQVAVEQASVLAGESLAGAAIRRTHGVTVAGIRRLDRQHISPEPDFVIKAGDTLLVAGRVESVAAFRKIATGETRP